MFNYLEGKKTYLVAVAMLINALVMFTNGQTSEAIQLVLEAFAMAGLRHGVSTAGINGQMRL